MAVATDLVRWTEGRQGDGQNDRLRMHPGGLAIRPAFQLGLAGPLAPPPTDECVQLGQPGSETSGHAAKRTVDHRRRRALYPRRGQTGLYGDLGSILRSFGVRIHRIPLFRHAALRPEQRLLQQYLLNLASWLLLMPLFINSPSRIAGKFRPQGRCKFRGATMIEVIFALSIIATLTVAAVTLYANAESSRRTTALLNQLSLVLSATRQAYAVQTDYGDSNAIEPEVSSTGRPIYWGNVGKYLLDSGYLPRNMKANWTVFPVAVNGSLIEVTGRSEYDSSYFPAVPFPTFLIGISNVPKSDCIRFVGDLIGKTSFLVIVIDARGYNARASAPQSPAEATASGGLCEGMQGPLQVQWVYQY